MKLLAVETATEACSAALLIDESVYARFELAPRAHAQRILPMIDAVLAEAGLGLGALDAIAFGRGPGSFTGVRIAAGVVQGLAFGADLPVVPVSTLLALAEGAHRRSGAQQVAAAIDARMDEVYWACFSREAGDWQERVAEAVVKPGEIVVPEGAGWYGAGSGWESYAESLSSRFGDRLHAIENACPDARDIAVLGGAAAERGEALPAEAALPVYLRDKVVS